MAKMRWTVTGVLISIALSACGGSGGGVEGSSAANVTAYSLTPLTTDAQFRPLVTKVLGALK
jgi:hypothetical protein